ncbi:hypothetical protein KAR91_39075 [Candidatus Pacearchaeota archaeon]|nr:hypothetical protein [Candidatus Pacearchaeota archaeon]
MRYKTITSYSGEIVLLVTAENQEQAKAKSEGIIENMDNATFLAALDPQFECVEVE